MEGRRQVASPISTPKDASPGSREITIMIMAKVGKIRSFTVSRRILLWLLTFLFLYILFSLFTISHFIDIGFKFRDQSEMLADMEERYNEMEKDLLKAQQRAANLDAYIESTRQKEESAGTASVQVPEPAVTARPAAVTPVKVSGQDAAVSVDIEELDIRRLDSGVVVDFRLTNRSSGNEAVEGYMHILVSNQDDNFPSTWNAPSKEIKNGVPSEYRSGERFIIQRFKQYHREFASGGQSGAPARIRILAYDTSGTLILEKEYEVRDE